MQDSAQGLRLVGATAAASAPPAAWPTVGLLSLIAVVSWLDRLILSLLVAPIGRDLGLSDGQFGLLLGLGFVSVYVVAGLPIATALDRGNRKWIVVCAVLLWCASTIASGFAQGFWSLLVTRSGVAIGEAALMPAAISMISDLFAPERRRLPTSVFMGVNILGATIAFLIGGLVIALIDRLDTTKTVASWRLTLMAVGALGLPVIGAFAIAAREPPRGAGAAETADAAATLKHLGAHAPLYLCAFAGIGLLAMVAQGSVAWMPTLLARAYGLEPAQVGGLTALTMAPASLLGIGLLPVLVGRRAGRDLVLRILCLLLLACVLAAPLALLAGRDSLPTLLASGAISMLGQGSLVALGAMLVQSVTPGPMRARLMAVFFLLLNLLSSGLAPTAVAFVATNAFTGPRALGGGLSVVATVAAISGALLFLAAYAWSRRREFETT